MSNVYDEKECDDMRMWAIELELEKLQKAMAKDRLELTAQKIANKALTQAHIILSGRLDRIVNAVGGTAAPSRKERK